MTVSGRIGLGAHLLNLSGTYRSAGISTFIFHLLVQLPHVAPDLQFHAFTGEATAPRISTQIKWHLTHLPTTSPVARIFWEQLIQPYRAGAWRLNLFHGLAYVVPFLAPVPTVVTVYDLSFFFFPYLFRPLNRLYLQFGTRLAVRRARRVIAISESTKRDLVRVFGIQGEKVSVTPCGVEGKFFADEKGSARDLPLRLPERFILHVGTLEPRKNLPRLVRAFAQAKRTAQLPHKLLLAGGRGWDDGELDRAIEDSGRREEIVRLGFVAPEHLPALYRAAEVFVYPSLYEGFGLPPLEAMASGTPVIVSNASSLPEVVTTAGIQVDPRDENALADALALVLTNSQLREELRTRGIRQARQFSWSATAQATALVYRDVLAESR